MLVKLQNSKFHENQFIGPRVIVTWGQTDGPIYMARTQDEFLQHLADRARNSIINLT
jgi:hypothetical protein